MENRQLDLSNIEMLILDEADRMLDMGFIDDVKAIAQATPKSRQTLLFSATVDAKLASVIRHLLKDPINISVSEQNSAPLDIKQEVFLSDNLEHKMEIFYHLLENDNIYKAIIFSATKLNADRLARQLREQGYAAAALHGDLKQNVRNRTIDQLRSGQIQFLVATDVAARGIDIKDITHVINFDIPKFCEDYVHRIGRTGRAGKSGIAISLVLPTDFRHVQSIERFIGQRLDMVTIEGLEPSKRFAPPAAKKAKKNGYAGKAKKTSSFSAKSKNGSYSHAKPKKAYSNNGVSKKTPSGNHGGKRKQRTAAS